MADTPQRPAPSGDATPGAPGPVATEGSAAASTGKKIGPFGVRTLAIMIGVLVLIVLAVVLLQPKTHTVTGEMELLGDSTSMTGEAEGDDCEGLGGYSDIAAGADVVIRDGGGELIATSRLRSGKVIVADTTLDLKACSFEWTVEDVPEVDFYEIEVARRGGLTYSKSEMEEQDWKISSSLGDFE